MPRYRSFNNARALPEKIRPRSAAAIGSALTAAIVLLIEKFAVLRVERRIGREQTMRGAEIGVPALGRSNLAVERGVGIE